MTRIVRLKADNFKRLKAVDITPDGNLVVISGRNRQGKTSVLDAITAALGGVSTKNLPKPIRDGAGSAEIILETEELTITRRFTPSGSTLTVTGKDGLKIPKGQDRLNGLLGRLSLDPLAFTQLDDKQQLKTLLDLVELPFDPAELDQERGALYDHRTELSRDLKKLNAQADAFDLPADCPAEEVSVSQLLAEYQTAQNQHAYQRDLEYAYEAGKAKVKDLDEMIATLQQEREAAIESAERARVELLGAAELPDLAAVQSRMNNAETINAQARQHKQLRAIVDQGIDLAEDIHELNAKIEAIDQRKRDGLAAAKFPGGLPLGFDETGVLLNGVPFKQASGAEQLRASLAMAIALNPELRVIRIADGSLLDSEGLRLVADMAEQNDYQVWLEVVSDDGEFGICIEDGEVADPEFF